MAGFLLERSTREIISVLVNFSVYSRLGFEYK
uniref:Uncharacterized protein n=1 Tax=Rhizobium phage IG49 TaxID=3129228 RepID=A0AAU8HZE3_9CAUD